MNSVCWPCFPEKRTAIKKERGKHMKKTTKAEIEQIYDLFREYRDAYFSEWERLENCERMYHGDHWYDVPQGDASEPRPVTPILQSTIESVRADLMDRIPEAIITADDQMCIRDRT